MSQPQNDTVPGGMKRAQGSGRKFLTPSVMRQAVDTDETEAVAAPDLAPSVGPVGSEAAEAAVVVVAPEAEPREATAASASTVVPDAAPARRATGRRGSARASSERALSVATDESTVGSAVAIDGVRYTRAETAGGATRLGTTVDQALADELRRALRAWEAANPDLSRELHPNEGSFREALLRLGLKHINDQEFASLIRPDRRFGAR